MTHIRRIRARCPRDRGPLLLEQDPHGAYLSCLSCGYVLEERTTPAAAADRSLPDWCRAQQA